MNSRQRIRAKAFYFFTLLLFYPFTFLPLIVTLHISYFLLQFLHLLFLQNSLILYWHHLDEVVDIMAPIVEHGTCELRTSIEIMLADKLVELLAIVAIFNKVNLHHIHIAEIVEIVVLVPYVGHTSRLTSTCRSCTAHVVPSSR